MSTMVYGDIRAKQTAAIDDVAAAIQRRLSQMREVKT